MSIGMRIAAMRGRRELTLEQLGGLVGVSKQTISNWEHGYRTPDVVKIRELCRALGCSADYLLELTDATEERW